MFDTTVYIALHCSVPSVARFLLCVVIQVASCLIYAWALLEYVNFIVWVCSVNKVLPSVKFAEYKVLTFLILCEEC